jgi:hypothetical protein
MYVTYVTYVCVDSTCQCVHSTSCVKHRATPSELKFFSALFL